ncbi:MFS transporter [Nakamurella lactea]|uniref:MFS transporter n=1 Tax=Nakamurella lactea TaxID=459515 RepID=UPI0004085A79|nr:MFS transporter [Nakamurella lactea]
MTERLTAPGPAGPGDAPAPGQRKAATPERTKTFASLRVRNYRLYFLGALISNNGTWMQRIAQDWLVFSLTGSSFAVGVTTALQFGPMLFFGLLGGLIADRYPQRRLLLITQVILGLLATTLAVITLTGVVQVNYIYLVALGLGLVTVIDNPARQTFVGVMVPQGLMRNAVSLNTGNFQLARLTGPAIAGLLIAAVGPGWAFAVNGASFVAVIGGLLLMRPAEFQPLERAARGRGQLREGLKYVAARPQLLWTIALVFFIGCFGFNFPIILTAYAGVIFHGGPGLYGWLNSTMAVGSLLGALIAARRATASMSMLFAMAGVFGAALMVLGVVPWLVTFLPLLALTGLAGVSFNTMANSSVQLATDPSLRGRVMSLYFLVMMGSTPIGSLTVGWITEHWGAHVALLITGAICGLASVGCGLLAARQAGISVRVDPRRGHQHLVLARRNS